MLVAALLAAGACNNGSSRPAVAGLARPQPAGAGGATETGGGANGARSGGADAANAGESGAGDRRQDDAGAAGAPTTDATAGAAGEAGTTSGQGTAGATGAQAGDAGVSQQPPPQPICRRGRRFGAGKPLSLSTADDDVLEGITPDALTLVFAANDRFFVADRSAVTDEFGAPLEAAAGLGFSSVTLSADGLTLVGAGMGGFAALTRGARGAAFSSNPDDADFVPLNAALVGNPTNEIGVEPLLGEDGAVLIYSFVSPSNVGSRPTLFASDWLGQWSFGEALPGEELLWADGQARRVATGLSSDGLTLFYRDEVAGEFRSAWRKTTDDEFDEFESLGELVSATPDASCNELYYSAEAASGGGLDLFVAGAD